MKDLDTLCVLGTQKTVFFQEQPVELIKKIAQLEKQLAIAIKALKDCNNDMKYWAVLTRRNQRILNVIKQALKEMEGVK